MGQSDRNTKRPHAFLSYTMYMRHDNEYIFILFFYFWEEYFDGTNHRQMSLQQCTEIHSDKTC